MIHCPCCEEEIPEDYLQDVLGDIGIRLAYPEEKIVPADSSSTPCDSDDEVINCYRCDSVLGRAQLEKDGKKFCSPECLAAVEYPDEHLFKVQITYTQWITDQHGQSSTENHRNSKVWATSFESAVTEVIQDIRDKGDCFIDSVDNVEIVQKNPEADLNKKTGEFE